MTEQEVVVYDDTHVNLILCWSHNVYEVLKQGAYQVCFECKHVYMTAEDLEKAYTRVVREMNLDCARTGEAPIPEHKPASEIYFCQECVHDF